MAADPNETEAWFEKEMEGLNGSLHATEHGESFDAFLNFYNQLPEQQLCAVMGGDLVLQHEGSGANMELRPMAVYGTSLVVEDIKGPTSSQDKPVYYFVRGSFLVTDSDLERFGDDIVCGIAQSFAQKGKGAVAPIIEGAAQGLNVAYMPDKLCREARLIYARAHSLEGVRTQEMRTRTATKPLNGTIITVQPTPNQPLMLFVEDDFRLSRRIKNAYWRVGSEYQPLLSYV